MTTDTSHLNPMGISLTNTIQAALAEFVTNIVNTAVTQAMLDAKTGSLAAVLLDESLNDRIRDVIADMKLATKDDIAGKLREHNEEYDHDKFTTDDDLKSKIERVLEDISVTLCVK